MEFNEFIDNVIAWGKARGIVDNGNPIGQAAKTAEEVAELLQAILADNKDEIRDAVGDIMVTLLMVCATADVSIKESMQQAWDTIKDRKGYLRPDGIFVKEE